MFTITTYYDDRYHPLHGDTYAAARKLIRRATGDA